MQEAEQSDIGARIKQARRERGMTQDELAAMASFSKRSLQDYEAGDTTPYRHLSEIGRLLNKSPDWILYGDEALGALNEQQLREIVREEVEAALAPLLARLGLPRENAA
jgi:transcriptional regulator with XRE-family HTH domain